MAVEVTTLADDLAVLHVDGVAHRFEGLEADTSYTLAGQALRTLKRPPGELLCRFATVNDIHFGEVECGRIDDHPIGPIQRRAEGEEPYPEVMNRGAVEEISTIDPAAVVVKGDLTADGRPEELAAFHACYLTAFGERLHVIRGNHDAYHAQKYHVGDHLVDLPGIRLALLDTVIPCETTGRLTPDQLQWLDDLAVTSDRPVLAMGHHQNWVPGKAAEPGYFGIAPHDSTGLLEVVARRPRILGYFAGHTHRNRVRHTAGTDSAVFVEVGCVKDFPGSWAEYRVFEGGVLQVHHRISTPEALRWSEQCRHLYRDFGVDYESYALGRLEDRCFAMMPRATP